MDTRNDDANTGTAVLKAAKPSPIFVYGVTSLPEMQKRINEFLDEEKYTTKILTNDTIKLICQTPHTYRTSVRYMRDNNIIHHTYQPKEECSYRVVIKYLHHSLDAQNLRGEVSQYGHKVRNIINAKHLVTKDPLNLFFLYLELSDNNKDIYKLNRLQNTSSK